MMSSAVQTNEKRKKPKCQLCRNHGIMDAFTSNHTDCPYVKDHLCELPTCSVKQDHPCEMCCITKEKREANKTVIKRQRKQEKGKFEELPLNRNRIRHRQECTKCRNHDQISVLSSKHKKECNWKDCPCPLCVTTSKLRTTSQILTQHNRRAAKAFNQVSKIAEVVESVGTNNPEDSVTVLLSDFEMNEQILNDVLGGRGIDEFLNEQNIDDFLNEHDI